MCVCVRICVRFLLLTGMPCEARTLATGLGYTQCASFSPDSQFVALGHGFEVLVYHIKVCELGCQLVLSAFSHVVCSRRASPFISTMQIVLPLCMEHNTL